ncbi:MAG TPA: TolC family protein, partial [Balneolaceae bacterium]|nr:TolC family protein [Balneolaceae bacterium]
MRQCLSVVGRGWGGSKRGRIRNLLILLILTVFPIAATAQQPDSTSQLQNYLQIAAEQNPKLKAEFYQYRAVLAQAPQVGTLPDPKVMFMYFTNPMSYSNPLSRMSISVSQQFPWFGTLEAAEDRVQELAKAKRASFLDSRNELFRNIKEVWFQMYEVKHHLKILGENLELLQSLESRALTLYETGRTGQVDVLRLQMEIDKVKNNIKQKKERLEPLRARFNAFLNRDPQSEIHLPMPMEHHTLALVPDQLLQKIVTRNPEFSRLDFRKQAAQYALEKARLDGLPSFSIGVEAMLPNYMYMSLMPGERTALVAKFSIKIPLYRSRYKAQKQEARLTIRSIEQQQNNLENMLTSDAEKRLQEYHDAQYRITLYEDRLIPKTNRALEIAIESYSAEMENFEELIRLQQQLLEYEMG